MRLPRYLLNLCATVGCFLLAFLAVTAHGQTISWSEDWESDSVQEGWYAENGIWEVGVPTSGPSPGPLGWRAHQGTNCAATVLGGNCLDGRESPLVHSGPIAFGWGGGQSGRDGPCRIIIQDFEHDMYKQFGFLMASMPHRKLHPIDAPTRLVLEPWPRQTEWAHDPAQPETDASMNVAPILFQ